MFSVLLVDDDGDHAKELGRALTRRGVAVLRAANSRETIARLRNRAHVCDIVILCLADRKRPWLAVFHDLLQASREAGFSETPRFLCVSRIQFGSEFQLQIERMGARYVYER